MRFLAVMHEPLVYGSGGQPITVVSQEDVFAEAVRTESQIATQGAFSLRRDVDDPLAGTLAADHQARPRFIQVEAIEEHVGDLADPQPTAQHEQKHGPIAESFGAARLNGMVNGYEEGLKLLGLDGTGQALPLTEEVAFG